MSSIEKAMQRSKAAANEKKPSSVQAAVESEDKLTADVAAQQPKESKAAEQPEVSASQTESVAKKDVAQHTETRSSRRSKPAKQPVKDPSHLGAGISPEEAEKVAAAEQQSDDANNVSPDVPTLHIDLESLEEKGFVTLREKRSLINEEYRSIKRKLLNNAFGAISKTLKHSNLILVSSSKPNEGKTFTSVNLALSIALEQDKTVLLVDSDVLKPSVAKTLNIGKNVGLIDYLLGEQKDVSKIMYRTNIDNLRIIPAGLPHHLSNELLSSDKMIKLIEEFASRYPDRIVVFDAPPLLGVNETSVMAEQCGQGVVVVEEHKSKIADVQKAVALLPEEMAVGFVLNKVTSANENQGYGYYYGSSDNDEDEQSGSKRAK